MGEARRNKLAGYVPAPKVERPPLNMRPIGHVGAGAERWALISALLMADTVRRLVEDTQGEGGHEA